MLLLRNFKYLCKMKHFSLNSLSKQLDIGSSNLSRIMRGIYQEKNLPLETVVRLANVFEISLQEFVFVDIAVDGFSLNGYDTNQKDIYFMKNRLYLSSKNTISLNQLSIQIGMHRNTLNMLNRNEKKEKNVTIGTVAKLASYFNLTLDELVFEDLSKKEKKVGSVTHF